MAMQYLYDNRGRVLGWLKEVPTKIQLFSWQGKLLGWYDTRIDKTFAATGRLVGRGNILASLLQPRP